MLVRSEVRFPITLIPLLLMAGAGDKDSGLDRRSRAALTMVMARTGKRKGKFHVFPRSLKCGYHLLLFIFSQIAVMGWDCHVDVLVVHSSEHVTG